MRQPFSRTPGLSSRTCLHARTGSRHRALARHVEISEATREILAEVRGDSRVIPVFFGMGEKRRFFEELRTITQG